MSYCYLKNPTDGTAQVLERADFTIPVEIEGQYHNIYVIKRPGVDQFMKRVGELYEVVVFTASVSKVSLVYSRPSFLCPVFSHQLAVWRPTVRSIGHPSCRPP
jgi:hypothetical protein